MASTGDPNYPKEFHINGAGGSPLTSDEQANQLIELFMLRSTFTRLSREVYRLKTDAEALADAHQKHLSQVLKVGLSVVDDFRLLLAAAQRSLGDGSASEGLFAGWLRGKDDASTHLANTREWFVALGRALESAISQFESLNVFLVPLLNHDLRVLEVEGQPVKRWVSVKNKPSGDSLVVIDEVRGLWLARRGNQLVLVQRGEVVVQ
jgi:hypothetical protein